MGPENASQMGYLLLLVGIALSIIGYVIYINIRGEKGSEASEEVPVEGDSAESKEMSPDWVESLQGEGGSSTEPISIEAMASEIPESAQLTPAEPDTTAQSEDEIKPALVSPSDPELIPVASLFREGVSGQLVIKVGEKQYSNLETLKHSKDWPRVRSLATDLANWIEAKPGSQTPSREGSAPAAPVEPSTADSDSMIAQINEIISRKVQSMHEEDREIRLVEGALGALEVRIGVEKYPIDEVPYTNVRDLIQEAVSHWERSQ